MAFDSAKAKDLILWIAYQLDTPSIPDIWSIIYLAERSHLALTGRPMIGDIFVAMKRGPVPLQAYTELYARSGRWLRGCEPSHLDIWLKGISFRRGSVELAKSFTQVARHCICESVKMAKQLGMNALGKQVRGPAWEHAGLDGLLDPLEMAKEGGADAATLDHINIWRETPYKMEATVGLFAQRR